MFTRTQFSTAVLASLLFAANFALALKEPEILFDIETDKKIERINILGEKGEQIFLHRGERLWMHDGNTGKKIWEEKIPGYTDDGLDLIWNSKYFITSMKKGMRCYDLANGKVVWETPTEVKMKTFRQYINFQSNFILFFKKQMQSFNPNTGEILWVNENFEVDGMLEEAGLSNIYQFSRDYGDRLLLLGEENAVLYDGRDGKIIGSAPVKWDSGLKKMKEKGETPPDPVATVGDDMITLFCEETTLGFNLKTGEVMWKVDEAVDRKHGYLTFDKAGSHYALFGFTKKSIMLNLDQGKVMWETGEDIAMEPLWVNLQSDGTLFYLGHKKTWLKKIQPFNVIGAFLMAYGLDFETGKPKWGPSPVAYTTMATASVFGINPQFVAFQGPWERPDGLLFYVFGQETRVPAGEFKEKGGEGLVLIDPKSGQIKWRTNFTMYPNWLKNVTSPTIPIFSTVHYKGAGLVPDPVFEGDAAYIPANNTVIKVDLTNGKTIWEGPDYSFVYNFQVDRGRVFGQIGYAKWRYKANAQSQDAEDDVTRTKKVGYFVLDASNGKEVFSIQKAKEPLTLQLEHYDPTTNAVYLCDGEVVRRLDLGSGKYGWEMDLDEMLNGPIGAEDGVIFKVSNVESSQSWSFQGGGAYTITTKTVTTYDISMEHRIEVMGDRLLVLAKEGPAMVGLDGKIIWKGEWDWKTTKINFSPRIVGNGIVYQYKKKLTYISLADGSIIWQTKESGDADFAFDQTGSKIFIIGKDSIAAYKL
jgi:outer membrane protein assembly factor BamB